MAHIFSYVFSGLHLFLLSNTLMPQNLLESNTIKMFFYLCIKTIASELKLRPTYTTTLLKANMSLNYYPMIPRNALPPTLIDFDIKFNLTRRATIHTLSFMKFSSKAFLAMSACAFMDITFEPPILGPTGTLCAKL